ncbi:sulfotransferase [Frankia sp. AgB1.9]|uniref:sulfotransferase family protein n=1 Tax=unclassified Frankia TaxID=2632575 RepID=UPI001934A376|nr:MULTISPECIES: sulfotransferase [unclassified Frankia]MBL7487215.1 sulfotransferase [Frankia sp. AgW1.1]MBL7547961.1 sulfotransferase [Frankia sp. AgB1.9]MBL7625046.1 sulfotransferase [Frankia sp. AgB1.8]
MATEPTNAVAPTPAATNPAVPGVSPAVEAETAEAAADPGPLANPAGDPAKAAPVREYTWRDAELRNPPLRLLNAVGAGLRRLRLDRPALSPEKVVAAAQARARAQFGADDLGSASYREPLERYLAAAAAEADLTTFGRLLVTRMLANALVNRIALHAWTTAHPEIRSEQIESPWIIVGLPRTGTSLLSILLGLDPLSRPLRQWEAAHPIPPPTLETAAEDPRIAQSARELGQLLRLNPALGAMHPFGATVAEECIALFMYDLRTLGIETQAHVPSYGRWLETTDMTPAYAQHKLALQAFQSAQPTGHWVLKSPNHLWCLPTLLAAYPDARVIWTHRDPAPVVTSLASLNNAAQRPLTSRTDPRPTAEEWKGKARRAISAAMAFDTDNPPGWCVHVRYDQLMADPVGAVASLYERSGLTVHELHARRMRAWLAQVPQDAHGRHRYTPTDFGWTYPQLTTEFADYTTRYAVPTET